MAEIKRTEGSHSVKGNTAGHASTRRASAITTTAIRSPCKCHFYFDLAAYKQTISIATVAPAN
ncbi:MAG TPA: hypothetical protein VFY27_09305, partial [Woeseiaceae bacterium]|nr:hypothetical protein [Woeseiaceae bacterium]